MMYLAICGTGFTLADFGKGMAADLPRVIQIAVELLHGRPDPSPPTAQ